MKTDYNITLTKTVKDHLDSLFRFQLDPEGGYLAAFMPNNHDTKPPILKNIPGS